MERDNIAGCIDTCGTPSYVFDLDVLDSRIKSIEKSLDDKVTVCYAMKANPFLVEPLKDSVQKFEVCSPGEFRICERIGLDMNKVVLSGVYKNSEDIRRIMSIYGDQLTYTVESETQFCLLSTLAEEMDLRINLLLRLTGGNQFGMDKIILERVLEKAIRNTHLHVKGLQLFSGTQRKKPSQIGIELLDFDSYCAEIQDRFDCEFEELEFGPGLYVSYFNHEEEQDENVFSGFCEFIPKVSFKGRIVLEIGRFIAASCGWYLSSVVDIKENEGKKYCIIDGGINHVNYYGQTMALRTPYVWQYPPKAGELDEWTVCGSLCTVGDVLLKRFPLADISVGDVLVFEKIGAYSITEGLYLFLSRDLPKVWFRSKSKGLRMVREELPIDKINCGYYRYHDRLQI